MKRIVLFRFHIHPSICMNRIELLKKYNPGMEIYGLYGGPENKFGKFVKALSPHLKNLYCIKDKAPFWKWKNGDLAVKAWYKDIGRTLSFDMLHLIEWDLLLFDSLDRIYGDIPEDGMGVASLTPVEKMGKDWAWTGKEPYAKEFGELLNFARSKFGYDLEPYAIQGPGLCMPRKFLEAYIGIDIPELCNDEIRIPLFAQIFGFKMHDTRFCKNWSDESDRKAFHCQLFPEVGEKTLKTELADPSGRRVFHPFRRTLGPDDLRRSAGPIVRVKESLASSWKKLLHVAQGACRTPLLF